MRYLAVLIHPGYPSHMDPSGASMLIKFWRYFPCLFDNSTFSSQACAICRVSLCISFFSCAIYVARLTLSLQCTAGKECAPIYCDRSWDLTICARVVLLLWGFPRRDFSRVFSVLVDTCRRFIGERDCRVLGQMDWLRQKSLTMIWKHRMGRISATLHTAIVSFRSTVK